ncbi:MAG: ABC transporter ATP-binding protein [Phycisphaeraceae bacterium]|nr:ABC transporter ATP-binding protein [Phycisphaeraceae bacterium]
MARVSDAKRPLVETRDVRVDYGDLTAVHDLTLDIHAGEIAGLIGPNGAGKTSLMRVLATLLEPTYGQVTLAGIDALAHPRRAHPHIGYMPDMPMVPSDLTCREFLMMFAGAYGLEGDDQTQRVKQCIDEVGLSAKTDAMASTLSMGMRQRLVLAKTMLHKPSILLLDEPASGLDPLARIQLRDTLRRLAQLGCAILVSSHILSEMSDLCSTVCIMDRGRIVHRGRIDDLVRQMDGLRQFTIRLVGSASAAAHFLREHEHVESVHEEDARLRIVFTGDDVQAAALLGDLVSAGHKVISFAEKSVGVEDLFLQLHSAGAANGGGASP